jgi:transcription initiation factor TFIIIB Brf1 subunit/transcription initiation factor TFIIB
MYITQLDNNIKDDIHTKGKERTQMSFAQTAGITHVTLRHSIKDLKNQLVLLN